MIASHFYRPHKKTTGKKRRIFMPLLKLFFGLFLFAIIASLAVFAFYSKDLPDPAKINERQVTESTKIFDRTGKILLYDIHGEEKRTVVPFDQISTYAKQAAVAIEDANFYQHIGLDFKGILRAAVYNLIGRRVSQGGSTITQQFIKKSLLSDERTLSRKIKEAVLSLELERKYSKNEILGFYLNQIPYGSNAYGIEAASQTFFGKPAKDLTLAESALLASLPKAPSRLSPYGSHPEDMKARQEYVLDRMAALGYISQADADNAKKEQLSFTREQQGIKAPHFVMYVKEYLEEKYGQEYVETAGLKVYTTLDWDLQNEAEQIIKEGAQNNEKKYGAYNAALAAIDPKSGQILVMVGSRDYDSPDSLPAGCTPGKNCRFEPNVNVTIRDRQPGSSFKPFAYATAFKKGFTTETILFDLKTEFNPNCPAAANQEKDQYGLECYHPSNYDGGLRGPVTARQALAQSLNIPSVQMLYLAGIEDTIKIAKDMGITSLNDPYYGLSLVLGGGEVKLLDEIAAYGVFAADGVKYEKTPILRIEDGKGKTIEEFASRPKKILEPQYARMTSNILTDNVARSPVFGQNSALYFADRPVAAKTGTTQKYRDAWTLGYTPSLAVGIWVGNNDNSPMSKAGAGISAAGPLWHSFFQKAYEMKTVNCESPSFCLPKDAEQFPQPSPTTVSKPMLNGSYISEEMTKIDRISGQLATAQTPPELIEEKPFKQVHNILHYIDKNNPLTENPAQPQNDQQYANWEASVQNWLTQSGQFNQLIPTGQDTLHTIENLPKIKIIYPQNGDTINQSTFILQTEASAPLGIKQIDYFLDDEFIGSSILSPYQIVVSVPPEYLNNGGKLKNATIKARAYDTVLNRSEISSTIYFDP